MTKIVVDTNCLLDNPELLLDGNSYAISYTTLQELDKLKGNQDLSYPARMAIKVIYGLFREGSIEILNVPEDNSTNDEKIVQDTKDISGKLMSQDIGALVVAKAKGVDVVDLQNVLEYDKNFKGYTELTLSDKDYYRYTQNEYQHCELDVYYGEDVVPPINSYVVLYPKTTGTNYLVFRKLEDKYVLVPQGTKHTLRQAGIGIDWLHPEQLIAFDCVFNTESKLAVITGKIGSSKTLMSMCAALSRVCGSNRNKTYDKIMVTRPNIPVNRSYALGFMPGSLEEKMSGWLAPIKTNLQFLYETTAKDRENEEAEKIYSEFFEAMPIESIQGASYHNKILIVDEAQLLDHNTLRQIMSRVAEGSKLVLILDPSQTYGANRGMEGYKKLLPHCKGNKHISFVELQHIQRSELTKVVDQIFQK
jgi:PhoH-like ATPase